MLHLRCLVKALRSFWLRYLTGEGGGGRGKGEYCKLPLISPGLIHPSYVVLRGLYPRGLINGGAYTLGGL